MNVASSVTALDWSHMKHDKTTTVQYLAFACEPLIELDQASSSTTDFYTLIKRIELPNFIHIYKFYNLNKSSSTPDAANVEFSNAHFALRTRHVGYVNVVKWRPDFGASKTFLGDDFIGYLLVAGSDGNGYIYSVEDLTKSKSYVSSVDGKILLC